jgi:hypothetical protein
MTRWRHCHPERWNKAAECAVETFPEPLSSVITHPFYVETRLVG